MAVSLLTQKHFFSSGFQEGMASDLFHQKQSCLSWTNNKMTIFMHLKGKRSTVHKWDLLRWLKREPEPQSLPVVVILKLCGWWLSPKNCCVKRRFHVHKVVQLVNMDLLITRVSVGTKSESMDSCYCCKVNIRMQVWWIYSMLTSFKRW